MTKTRGHKFCATVPLMEQLDYTAFKDGRPMLSKEEFITYSIVNGKIKLRIRRQFPPFAHLIRDCRMKNV
jgi:hypothetical protein